MVNFHFKCRQHPHLSTQCLNRAHNCNIFVNLRRGNRLTCARPVQTYQTDRASERQEPGGDLGLWAGSGQDGTRVVRSLQHNSQSLKMNHLTRVKACVDSSRCSLAASVCLTAVCAPSGVQCDSGIQNRPLTQKATSYRKYYNLFCEEQQKLVLVLELLYTSGSFCNRSCLVLVLSKYCRGHRFCLNSVSS